MDLLQSAQSVISREGLLSNGDSVLVALSGGPDSVALLHLLTRMRRSSSLKLHALYINHGLRPRQALREENFCRELCHRWHIGFRVVRADIPALAKKRKIGFEEAARDFRYRTLEGLAVELSCDKIALGHQADDQVETILFRMLRGTGRTGLLGIPVKRGKIIRPLIEIPRVEILRYLNRRRISYCHDSSNTDLDYRRNYLRHKLLPEIRERLNPNVDRALCNLSELISAEEEFLSGMNRRVFHKIARPSPGGKLMLDLQIYLEYPLWLRRRVVRSALAELTQDQLGPDKEVIDRIDSAAQVGSGSLSAGGGVQVEIARQQIIFKGPAKVAVPREIPLDNRWVSLGGFGIDIRVRAGRRRGGKLRREKRSPKVLLDRAQIQLPLKVRSIRPGDQLVPLGMTGRKKVGDYLTDRKVPVARRDEIPVVCDDKGIVWLVGFEIADRVKIQDGTTEVIHIEYREHKTPKSKTV